MANLITHLYVAKQVLERLPAEIRAAAEKHKDAYLFGSGGPDFLFVLREIGHSAARYCNTMHFCRTYETFSEMLAYVRETGDAAALSYILGFICHYAVDSTVHPLVFCFSEEVFPKDVKGNQILGVHNLMESAIDTYLLENCMGYKSANDYDPSKEDVKTTRKTRKAIARLYCGKLNPLFGFSVAPRHLRLSVKTVSVVMHFCTDKKGKKQKYLGKKEENNGNGKKSVTNLLRPPEYYGELDFMNLQRRPYRILRNREETDTKTVLEILEDGIQKTILYQEAFLKALAEGGSLKKEDYQINFEGVFLPE